MPPRKDDQPRTMQDRNRSFLDIRSLFQSCKRPRSPNPPPSYHYKKRESSSSGPNESAVADQRTIYILQRSLMDQQVSNGAAVFRQLSVKDPPNSPPRTQQTSLRSSRRSSGSSGVFQPDAMRSADSLMTLSPAQFPSPPRSASASPHLPRRGGISPTPRRHGPSGLNAPQFSHVARPTERLTPHTPNTPNTRDVSYSRPTPFAYPSFKNRRSYNQHRPSVELRPSPAPGLAPQVAEPIDPSFPPRPRHEPNGGGQARPATHSGYRDRMLVHASVNRNWETQ